MPTYTTNYNLAKPLVNNPVDQDLFGYQVNDDLDTIDTLLDTAINWIVTSAAAADATTVTVTTSDYHGLFLLDATDDAMTLELPSAATAGGGFTLAVKKTDSSSNAITITPDGSETLDGETTWDLDAQYEVIVISSDGTNWVSLTPVQVDSVPLASVFDYAGTTSPAGYELCYGQAISRTTYAGLYAIIGTTYGTGDGSTTFNLPDARGRVVAGQDDMGGTSANRLTGQTGGVNGDVLGGTGGAETHTLTTAQMPSHAHDAYNTNSTGGSTKGYWAYGEFGTGTTTSTNGTLSTGGGGAHNNIQPTLILNKIIKVI